MSARDEDEDQGSSLAEQPHVSYILTAEFDVDAGPIISNQYPEPLGGDVRYKTSFQFSERALIYRAKIAKFWQS